MKFMITGRRSGKTTKVLEFCKNADTPILVLCINNIEAKRIEKIAKEKQIELTAIGFDGLRLHRDFYENKFKTIIIDNLEMYLYRKLGKFLSPSIDSEVFCTATGELIRSDHEQAQGGI